MGVTLKVLHPAGFHADELGIGREHVRTIAALAAQVYWNRTDAALRPTDAEARNESHYRNYMDGAIDALDMALAIAESSDKPILQIVLLSFKQADMEALGEMLVRLLNLPAFLVFIPLNQDEYTPNLDSHPAAGQIAFLPPDPEVLKDLRSADTAADAWLTQHNS